MIRGLYSTAASLEAAELAHQVVARNLAHAHLAGYRRQVVAIETFDQALQYAEADPAVPISPPDSPGSVYTVFDAGSLRPTENPLDVAIRGDGFFVLDGPNGPLYTRNGVLELSAQGELTGISGYRARGASGPITIPGGAAQITIREDGTVLADSSEIGRLDLAHFKDRSVLVPVGPTLFEAPSGVRPSAGTSTVHQGYREGSNVEPVSEMVHMIVSMRHFEAAQRALKALSEALEQNTQPLTG